MQHHAIAPTHISPVVVAPTFDNAATLAGLLACIRSLGLPLIVIDDGSRDDTPQILEQVLVGWRQPSPWVLRHDENAGKAAALASGFAAATRLGFSHAVTIDTDGQHDPGQIPLLLASAQKHPGAIILGTRDKRAPGRPLGSRLGCAVSNFLLHLECHRRLQDSQCGMRVYPLALVNQLHCRAKHYGFETEILVRATWSGHPIMQIPVACRYLPPGQGVNHFRPLLDSLRAVRMHARLMTRASFRWPGLLTRWLSPMRAWRDLRRQQSARGEFAAGLAIGVFIACLPAYGLQSLLSLLAARKFNLNPLSVLAGTQLSIPPITPLLIVCSLALGHLVLHGSVPHFVSWTAFRASLLTPAILRGFIMDWILGGILLGLVLALLAYVFFRIMFRFLVTDHRADVAVRQ